MNRGCRTSSHRAAAAGTLASIIAKLHAEIVAILEPAEVRDKFNAQAGDVIGSTPQQFGAHLCASNRLAGREVVREAGVAPE